MRRWVRIRTVRVHAHPGAYTETHRWQVGAYTCAGRGTCNLQLATCNLCVYAAAVRVFLGIGRGIRRWVRIRASVTGAYLEPTQGRVSFVQESLLVGLVRIEYGARVGRPTRGPRPQRPTTPCTTHPSTDPHRTHPKGSGMPCGRYTARTREEGRSHSPEPSRNGLKPPSASHPTGAPPAFCASRTLLGRSDRTPAQSNKSNGSHCNHPWSSAWCVLWWAPAPTRVMP